MSSASRKIWFGLKKSCHFVLQNKEPVGNDGTVPDDIINGLETMKPEGLKVNTKLNNHIIMTLSELTASFSTFYITFSYYSEI